MLELRPNCELCDTELPPEAAHARICSYECTFCVECVDLVLRDVCPNCGGGFAPRPIRPRHSWRPNIGLAHDPPVKQRTYSRYRLAEIQAITERLHAIPPDAR